LKFSGLTIAIRNLPDCGLSAVHRLWEKRERRKMTTASVPLIDGTADSRSFASVKQFIGKLMIAFLLLKILLEYLSAFCE
jgi:hypothetical protein